MFLDRGFGAIEIARYFKQIQMRAIVACPIRGRTGGLKALCIGRKSYRTKHIFKSQFRGAEEVEMAMFKGKTGDDEKGQESEKGKMAGVYADRMR